MSDILSQDEVDALLKGVESGDIETEPPAEDISGIRSYDFASQERVVRGRMPGLEIVNEMFANSFRNSISSLIMRFVDVNIHNAEIMKFGEFIKSVPFPSSINIIKMEPLKGYTLFVMEAPLVFALVEFFFGGTEAKYVKSEGKAFTSIEQRVIKKIVGMAIQDITTAWKGVIQITPEHVSSEMNPRFVTIVPPNEIVIKIEILLEIEDFKGKVFFCIPYPVIEPVKEKLYSGIQSSKHEVDQRWVDRLKEMLMDSPVEVSAEIGSINLTFGDLLNLEPGSVLNLGKGVSDEFVVKVEGSKKFYGLPGFSRGSQAIKITREY